MEPDFPQQRKKIEINVTPDPKVSLVLNPQMFKQGVSVLDMLDASFKSMTGDKSYSSS